jgi:cytochrome c oxidase subunit 4
VASSKAHTADGNGSHVLPVKVLVGTWAALMVLTGITVAAAQVDLGRLNVVVALAIAATKASIVALYFMHLKYGDRMNSIVLVFSLFMTAFFIGFVIFDTVEYQPDILAATRDAQHARPAASSAPSNAAPSSAAPSSAAPSSAAPSSAAPSSAAPSSAASAAATASASASAATP